MTIHDLAVTTLKPRILIVEDEELLLALFTEVIGELGVEVRGVVTADEGLAAFEQGPAITLLLTDVQTPGYLNGWDLAKAVYELRPQTPVIVMSGYAYLKGAELMPNATFIRKPCALGELCSLVKKRLGTDQTLPGLFDGL